MTDIRELALAKNWTAELNYTFMIHATSPDSFLKNMQRGERRRIKNFTPPGERVYHYDPSEFADLVVSGHHRYKIKPKANRAELKSWLLDLQYLKGIFFMGINDPDGTLSSGLLWSEFKQTASFFLAASRPPEKNNTAGYLPYILYKVMEQLHKKRITRIDLPGDEDKQRSVFKIDLGAVPQPHYTLCYAANPLVKRLSS